MNENTVDAKPTIDFSRRKMLLGGSLLGGAMMLPMLAKAASASPGLKVGNTVMKSVQFRNGAISLAGNLYLPAGFTEQGKYAAIIAVHPGGGVKEQTAGLYAQKLAEQGFVTLAFDAGHQGASGGEPRFLDDPMKRVTDIYCAVDYLVSLPYIDAGRIGALGVCAGSGQHPKAPNKLLLTSLSAMVSFTGFDQVETLLTQPLLVVAGSEAGSLWHSVELHAKAAGLKELVVIAGATHMDLYDGEGSDRAMSKLAPFFTANL